VGITDRGSVRAEVTGGGRSGDGGGAGKRRRGRAALSVEAAAPFLISRNRRGTWERRPGVRKRRAPGRKHFRKLKELECRNTGET
jgi:hypothetical protein